MTKTRLPMRGDEPTNLALKKKAKKKRMGKQMHGMDRRWRVEYHSITSHIAHSTSNSHQHLVCANEASLQEFEFLSRSAHIGVHAQLSDSKGVQTIRLNDWLVARKRVRTKNRLSHSDVHRVHYRRSRDARSRVLSLGLPQTFLSTRKGDIEVTRADERASNMKET